MIEALSLILAMGIGRFSFAPLSPMMQVDGLLNIMDGGYLASINLFGYLVGALFVAKLPCCAKLMLPVALIGVGLSVLAMGITEHFYLWLGLGFVCGIASAVILVLVSKFYIKHLGINHQTWIFSGVMTGMKKAHRIAPAADVVRHITALTASFAIGQMHGAIISSYLYQQSQSFTLSLVMASAALIITALILLVKP